MKFIVNTIEFKFLSVGVVSKVRSSRLKGNSVE